MASPTASRTLQFSPRCTNLPSPGASRPIATPFSDLRNSLTPTRAEDAQDDVMKQKAAMDEVPETMKKLQAQLQSVISTAAETEGLRQEIARLRSQLEKKDGDANGHLRELWSVRALMQTQSKELAAERETANNLREKLGSLRDEHSTMKERLEELESVQQISADKVYEMQCSIAQLEQQVEQAADREAAAQEEISKAKADLERLQTEASSGADQKEQQLVVAQTEVSSLKQELERLQSATSEITQQHSVAKEEIVNLKSALEQQTATALQANATAEEEVAKLQKLLSEQQAAAHEELSKAQAELEGFRVEAASGVEQKDQQLVVAQSEVSTLKQEIKRLEAVASDSSQQHAAKLAALNEEMLQVRSAETAAKEELSKAKATFESFQIEASSGSDQKEQQLVVVQTEVTSLKQEIERLQLAASESTQERAARTAAVSVAEEEISRLKAALEQQTAFLSQAQDRTKDLKQIRETLARRETDFQNAKNRLEEQTKRAKDREVELKELAQRLDEANKSKTKLQAKLKEQVQVSEQATREKKHDLALVECVREKEQEIAELQSELVLVRETLTDKDEVIREQACELAELEVQHRDQAERLRTCKIAMERLEQQRVEPMSSVQCQYQDDIDVRMQNRELLFTTKQLHQECEMLETENRSLKEANEYFLDELDQHANNIGHTNHKQKIRYTMKLKEELNRLFMELRKSRQQILHLETAQVNIGLLGARIPEQKQTARRHSVGTFSRPLTPRRSSPNRAKGSPRPSPCVSPGHDETSLHHRAEEFEHVCQLQSVALEKLNVDHQHLKTLLERVVLRCDYANGNDNRGSTSDLLQRLRDSAEHSERAYSVESHERVRCTLNHASKHAQA